MTNGRRVLLAGVLAGLLVANFAQADLEKGAIAPELEARDWLNNDGESLSLADVRGMVVVLFFFTAFTSAGGQDYMSFVNVMEASPGLGRAGGVIMIGISEADRKRVEPILSREKAFFPVGVESKAHEDYRIESVPRFVIINAEGRVSFSGLPTSGDDFARLVREAVGEVPPTRTHPQEAKRVKSLLVEAREAITKQDFKAAYDAAGQASDLALAGDKLKSDCQEYVDLIEAIARDQLAEVDSMLDKKNFADAVRTLRGVTRRFGKLDIAKQAQKRLESLKTQYPEIAQVLQSQQADAKARTLYIEGREAVESRRFGAGFQKLDEVIKQHAASDVTPHARAIVERMQKNPLVMAEVRDHLAEKECKTLLSQARNLIRERNYDRAKQLLKQVIEKHPDTSYSAQATSELANLP